jgi:hypothetical protein
MSDISGPAKDAREGARAEGGTFGVQEFKGAEGSVVAGFTTSELPEAEVQVTLQAWNDRDETVNIRTISFDARPVLDTMRLEAIEADEYGDDIYAAAQNAGLTPKHTGPTFIDLDYIADYVEARRAAGQEDPLTTSVPPRSLDLIKAELKELDERLKQVARDEFALGKEGLIATIHAEFNDEARQVKATEATIFNALAEYGEVLFTVKEIRGTVEGESKVLWTYAESRESDSLDEEKRRDALEDFSVMTDRFGREHLAQPADAAHPKPWYGFTL